MGKLSEELRPSTSIEEHQEIIKGLLQLAQDNPGLRIIPMVDTECVPGDDYGSYVAEWGKAEIDHVLVKDERIYSKSEDFEGLVDKVMFDFDMSDWKARRIVEGYEWEKVILVNIVP